VRRQHPSYGRLSAAGSMLPGSIDENNIQEEEPYIRPSSPNTAASLPKEPGYYPGAAALLSVGREQRQFDPQFDPADSTPAPPANDTKLAKGGLSSWHHDFFHAFISYRVSSQGEAGDAFALNVYRCLSSLANLPSFAVLVGCKRTVQPRSNTEQRLCATGSCILCRRSPPSTAWWGAAGPSSRASPAASPKLRRACTSTQCAWRMERSGRLAKLGWGASSEG
jgi:hypothetical protein